MLKTKKLGNLGEDLAAKYLKKKGYKILDRNFRYKGYGEIDIIAKKREDLHFVEVKTRENIGDIYAPEDNITYFKQKQLIKLAKIYLSKHLPANRQENYDIPWQIDVIAVEIDPLTQKPNLRHIEQAVVDFN
jgi:putative endonuclease